MGPVAAKLLEQHIWVRSYRVNFLFVVRIYEGDKGNTLFSSLWKLCIIPLWRRYFHFPSLKTSCLTGCLFPWVYSWPWWEGILCAGCEVTGRPFLFRYQETPFPLTFISDVWFGLAMLEFGSGDMNLISQKHHGLHAGLAVAGSLY